MKELSVQAIFFGLNADGISLDGNGSNVVAVACWTSSIE